MTETTNTEKRMTCAELIAMIRDAAENGTLTAEDLKELRAYAARIIEERDGTPEATA